MKFGLNGQVIAIELRAKETLLETLRERCGILSTKNGCQPQGQCGSCLVLIDGQPKLTCAMRSDKADGREIVTAEGLPENERDLLAHAFVVAGGLQCGFCIPGIAVRAYALVAKKSAPTRTEIAKALDVHLCRCTGYTKIVDAIEIYAAAKRGIPLPSEEPHGLVGTSASRVYGAALTLGARPFVDDIRIPGLLHAAVVLSPHARCIVHGIDVSAALAMPDVVRIALAEDVPGERRYGLLYNDWPGLIAVGETTSSVGDVLAVIAAKDDATARAAVAAVRLDLEVLVPITDPEPSLAPGAARVNPMHDNLLSKTVIYRGDVDAALAGSTHVVSGTWRTQRIEHLFLEPESCVAVPLPGGKLHMYTQGQGIFDDRRQVARFLSIGEDQIHVELVPNGGAFGGKEDMSIQAQTALIAWLIRQPVKITLTREESIRIHPKRHPITMTYTVGCNAGGQLTAVKARMLGDSGAYASVGGKVLERAAGQGCGAYRVPNVDIEAVAVYTNNPPCGTMRGFGANQGAFAMEGCMDPLADKLGLDPWEIRWRNALENGDMFTTGQVLEACVGLKKTLLAVRNDFYALRAAGKAVGIGCGIKNTGIGNGIVEWGKCRLVVEADGTVSLYNGYTEMGQGLLTVLAQYACEATGLPAKTFCAKVDTTYQLDCGQTTGSRATFYGGKAVLAAAAKLRQDLDRGLALKDLVGQVYAADIEDRSSTAISANVANPKTHPSFSYATQVVVLDGMGKLEKVIAAHDVGRAVNPKLCEGQLAGSVHLGLGYALTEDLPCEDGMAVTFLLRELGVLRALDMPELEIQLIEEADPNGPCGAKGVGEIGLGSSAFAAPARWEPVDRSG